MPTYTTNVPGLPGGPLVTSFPIEMDLIPEHLTRNRPGIYAAPDRRSIQHGTGNSISTARGEANYLQGGAEGRQASFHGASDDTRVVICVPLNEVTWQAADGSGPGNMKGLSLELCENTKMLAASGPRMIEIAAEFMGKCSARLGVVKGPQQHWDYNFAQAGSPNRHNCPNWLRSSPARWQTYVSRWNHHFKAERAAMEGTKPPTEPDKPVTYAPRIPVPELVAITNGATKEQRWTNAPSHIASADGTRFILVADVIEATQDTARAQLAYEGAKEVGPLIHKGERFIGLWLFTADDGKLWYLTEYWTRVREDHCTRIADAPILQGDMAA